MSVSRRICLFLGGPWHGERHEVDISQQGIRVAQAPGRLAYDRAEYVEDAFRTVWYERIRYHLGGGVTTVVYAHEGMPRGDIDRRMAEHLLRSLQVEAV